jgi:DNA-binding transcriptional ArsR family regulator
MDSFTALAEPTRRDIIEMLADRGQLPASSIYRKFNASPQAISQHLKILRDTKLVLVEKRAQQRLYEVNPKAINEVEKWAQGIVLHWNERFDRLDKLLKEDKRSTRGEQPSGRAK